MVDAFTYTSGFGGQWIVKQQHLTADCLKNVQRESYKYITE